MKRNVLLILLAFVVGTFAMAQTTELKKGYGQQKDFSQEELSADYPAYKASFTFPQNDGLNEGSALTPISNDLCADAFPITCNSSVFGATTSATADGAPYCGTSNSAPGVWYTFVGDGSDVELTTCSASTDYDTKLTVYTGSCGLFSCVAGDDDDFSCTH